MLRRRTRKLLSNQSPQPRYLDQTVYGEILSEGLGAYLPRLPSAFNPFDISNNLALGIAGLDILCIAPTTDSCDAGLVRANASIPPECEIFYYEVTVVDEADFNYIGIGFCSREAPLDQLPGWHGLSWGYHGDDGRAFEARYGPVDLTDDAFGPQFTLADAIGCGIDVENQLIFYTKNGEFLGLAFESFTSTSGLYPCVGLNAPNTCVVANFGALPFLFDIGRHIQRSRNGLS